MCMWIGQNILFSFMAAVVLAQWSASYFVFFWHYILEGLVYERVKAIFEDHLCVQSLLLLQCYSSRKFPPCRMFRKLTLAKTRSTFYVQRPTGVL